MPVVAVRPVGAGGVPVAVGVGEGEGAHVGDVQLADTGAEFGPSAPDVPILALTTKLPLIDMLQISYGDDVRPDARTAFPFEACLTVYVRPARTFHEMRMGVVTTVGPPTWQVAEPDVAPTPVGAAGVAVDEGRIVAVGVASPGPVGGVGVGVGLTVAVEVAVAVGVPDWSCQSDATFGGSQPTCDVCP